MGPLAVRMTIHLREYQTRALDEVRAAYKSGKRAPLLCAPTGSGKSAMTGHMLNNTKKRTLILAHRKELVMQISKALPVRHGLIMPGHYQTDDQIMVGMMQTVVRRLDRLPKFEWVISDEAHLAVCPTWLKILQHYADAWHLGMSASPCRMDGKGLGEHFDTIVYGPSVSELTDLGFLVPCRVFAPNVDVGRIRMSGGDYNLEEAAKEFGKSKIVGDAVSHVLKHARDRLTIVFCCSRKHAEEVAAQFTSAGLPAVNVDGALPSGERKARIDAFREGKIRVLTNVDLLTTGFDCPEIGAAVFLRPTKSLALYVQMVGRIMRPFKGKQDAILLDHANNVMMHGLPDQDREWSLDGSVVKKRKKKDGEEDAAVRQCGHCFRVHPPAPACPSCGFVYPIKSRIVATEDGELSEINYDQVRATPLRDVLRGVRTADQLRAIARERGYAPGWVFHQSRIRGIPLNG